MKSKPIENENVNTNVNPLSAEDLLGIGEKQDERFKFASTLYDGIQTTTDIPNKEIKLIIKLYYFADECAKYEVNNDLPKISSIVDKALNNYYKLRISAKREGRKEAIQFLTSQTQEEENKKGILNRFLRS
jgi:hypothetical protein